MLETLILVDEHDQQIGTAEKMDAHRRGVLHRAFSIFVFNSRGELMLQNRAKTKYHSGGLWTNTCCGHPRDGEALEAAAHRRLGEEMGFDCDVREVTTFIYQVALDHGLTEHEYLHVFVGIFDGEPHINPEEADGWKWITPASLVADVALCPEAYTHWFKICLEKMPEFARLR